MYHTDSYLSSIEVLLCILTAVQKKQNKQKKIAKRKLGLLTANHAHLSAHAHTLSLIQPVNCSLLRHPLSWSTGLASLILQRRLRQWKLGYCAALVLTEQASLGGDKDSNWLGLNESEDEDWLSSIQQAPPSLIMTTLRPIKCVWAVIGEIPSRGISSICGGCNYERMWGTKVNAQQVPSSWMIIIIVLPLASHCNLVI